MPDDIVSDEELDAILEGFVGNAGVYTVARLVAAIRHLRRERDELKEQCYRLVSWIHSIEQKSEPISNPLSEFMNWTFAGSKQYYPTPLEAFAAKLETEP